MSKGIFIGSFDPIHTGHIEIIKWALRIFDEVVIIVANNEKKNYWFSQEERIELVRKSIEDNKRIRIKAGGDDLIFKIAEREKIYNFIRGIKAGRTLEEEIRLMEFTKSMNPNIEFYYKVTSNADWRGSSIIKLLATQNEDFTHLVSPSIVEEIRKRASQK